jgi:deoxyxylulose-5-phosphate synthase
MKTVTNVVDKEFAKEIYQLIDKQHKEGLRKVDHQYRSLKDMITSWHDGLEFNESLGVHNLPSLDGKDEEELDELMAEIRAD